MMWGYNDGFTWLWMAGMMVLFWGGVAALVVFVVRAIAPDRGRDARGGDAAMDVLRKRLAGGEISQEEYDKTRKALQG